MFACWPGGYLAATPSSWLRAQRIIEKLIYDYSYTYNIIVLILIDISYLYYKSSMIYYFGHKPTRGNKPLGRWSNWKKRWGGAIAIVAIIAIIAIYI